MDTEDRKDWLPTEQLQETSTWARRYSQTRVLAKLILVLGFTLVFGGIFVSAAMAGEARRAGHSSQYAIWLAVLIVSNTLNVVAATLFGCSQ